MHRRKTYRSKNNRVGLMSHVKMFHNLRAGSLVRFQEKCLAAETPSRKKNGPRKAEWHFYRHYTHSSC